MRKIVYLFIVITLISCTKDREIDDSQNVPDTNPSEIKAGSLFINEFVAKGSTNANENGTYEDWIEIYNPNNYDLNMAGGHWFVTDDLSDPAKFELPPMTLSSKGFVLIWCDDQTGNDIHTDFKLSSGGESIGIFYKDSTNQYVTVDSLNFGPQNDGVSKGRFPDGSTTWQYFNIPTPGKSNN
ncbi:MAG: lamin tail domain-containing protein [Bacteroidales bacterium]|nr:lamin tail domain-containing protein [Bacteroidales bacterium]